MAQARNQVKEVEKEWDLIVPLLRVMETGKWGKKRKCLFCWDWFPSQRTYNAHVSKCPEKKEWKTLSKNKVPRYYVVLRTT